jgi:hypothetical protein
MNNQSNFTVSKEDLERLISFIENDFFSIYRKTHWVFMVIMLILIFIIVGRKYIPYALVHVITCLIVAFLLAHIHIRKRTCLIFRNAHKYIPVAELQHRWLSKTKSMKQSFSMEWSLPLKYFHARSSIYWKTGEAIFSWGFFVLYAIPVIVPVLVGWEQFCILAREGYFVLYPLLLLFITYSFFWLVNFYLWNKKIRAEFIETFNRSSQ